MIGNLVIQSIRTLAPGCGIFLIEPSSFAADMVRTAGVDGIIPAKEAVNGLAEGFMPEQGHEKWSGKRSIAL